MVFFPLFEKEFFPMTYHLSHPEYFTLTAGDGKSLRGASQEWYKETWQRRAGCGPTTAATVLAYLSRVHKDLENLKPSGAATAEDFLGYMEEIWPYVTPGSRGLDKAESFVVGCRSFALARGTVLLGEILEIPKKLRRNRPDLATCRQFIAKALKQDKPVAFLNYSNGDLNNLDSWHWVPLIAMTDGEGSTLCTVLDEGEERVIDFALWLESSLLGGALAVVGPVGDGDLEKLFGQEQLSLF